MFQRASCLVGGNSQREVSGLLGKDDAVSNKLRGLQCLFRREQRVNGFADSFDYPCKQTTMDNMSMLSTEDVATDNGSIQTSDNLSSVDLWGPSEPALIMGTLSPVVEVSMLATQSTMSCPEIPEEDAKALAQRAMAHFRERMQRRDVRQVSDEEKPMLLGSAPMPPPEHAQPLLVRQLNERLREEKKTEKESASVAAACDALALAKATKAAMLNRRDQKLERPARNLLTSAPVEENP